MVKPLVPPMVDILGPYVTTPQHALARPGRSGDASGAGFTWCKDCTDENAEDGTPIIAVMTNNFKAQFLTLFQSAGVPIDDRDEMLSYGVQSGALNYAVATGTANAWEVAPALAIPAYAAGRVLNIIAPATNTSTTVNMAVSGLANRRIKKSDGADPAIGDFVGGRAYPSIDDGATIRILSPLASDIKSAASGLVIPGNILVFQTSAIYTPSGNMVAMRLRMVGGGGAGGVGDTGGYWGGGGGSGAMVDAYFKRAHLAATEPVTIGGGGYGYPPTGMYGGENGGNTTFKNMIAGGGGGGGTAPGAHGASGLAGVPTIAGPGIGVGIRGADGPFGARWDTPSALGVYGRGGSPGSLSLGFGGSAGFGGICIIEEYLLS